jgi:hypothetical protein
MLDMAEIAEVLAGAAWQSLRPTPAQRPGR